MIMTGTRVEVQPLPYALFSSYDQTLLYGLKGQVVSDNKFRHHKDDPERYYEVLFDSKVIVKGLLFRLDELVEVP